MIDADDRIGRSEFGVIMAAVAGRKQPGHRCWALPTRAGLLAILRFLRGQWAACRPRPWLAVIACPLAMIATAECGLWWAWPVLLVCSRGWTRRMIWNWVLSLEEGVVGSEWAFVGTGSLASFPADRALVGALWTGFPLALAAVGWRSHRAN